MATTGQPDNKNSTVNNNNKITSTTPPPSPPPNLRIACSSPPESTFDCGSSIASSSFYSSNNSSSNSSSSCSSNRGTPTRELFLRSGKPDLIMQFASRMSFDGAESKSSQGSRVAKELEALRQKHLTNKQRDRLKDIASPLTTPEEAQAFLAAMRDKTRRHDIIHQPPSNLTADGMENWFLQQRRRERELRLRRKEAEELLRGYRATAVETGYGSGQKEGRHSLGTPSNLSLISESLHDPAKINLTYELDKEGEEKDEISRVESAPRDEEEETPHAAARSKRNSYPMALPKRTTIPVPEEEKKTDDLRRGSSRRSKVVEVEEDEAHTPPLLPPVGPAIHPQVTTSVSESDSSLKLPETIWRDFISSEPGAKFPPESGRYHLYLSYACPGSHRALIVRALKGLEDVVSVTYVHPTWRLTNPNNPHDKHRGWVFGDPIGEPFSNTIGRGGPFPASYRDTDPDPVFSAYSIREIYERANDTSGKYTIPLLWDKKLNTIVNNESSDIAYMLNSCFNDFSSKPDLDLYTETDEDGRARLNEVSEWLAPLMIHGVYRCGFAKNQKSYDKAIGELCEAYDRADDILARQRYLTGDTLTDADIRLFVTLFRFDEVYAFYFKANARLVMLTPSLLNFCREIYQMPGVRKTCDMEQIKAHFYGSHAEWNKYSVIPRGLGFLQLLEMPHDREDLSTSSCGNSCLRALSYEGLGSFEEATSSFITNTMDNDYPENDVVQDHSSAQDDEAHEEEHKDPEEEQHDAQERTVQEIDDVHEEYKDDNNAQEQNAINAQEQDEEQELDEEQKF